MGPKRTISSGRNTSILTFFYRGENLSYPVETDEYGRVIPPQTPKCPLWHPKMKHPNHCCKLVGCPTCKNKWCRIGNLGVEAPMFYGYLAVKIKDITIGYINLSKLMKKRKDCFVHDPEQEGAQRVPTP